MWGTWWRVRALESLDTSVFSVSYWYSPDVAYLRPSTLGVVLLWNGGMVGEL